MRILQLCPRLPFPPIDGGAIGMYNLSCSLVEHGAEVKVLAFNTSKHYFDEKKIDTEFVSRHRLETVYLDNKVKVLDALLNLFTNESYHISRFKSAKFSEKLIQILKVENFDIIQLDYLPMALYIDEIRQNSTAKIVLRAHNVEHRIWRRLAVEEKNFFKKWYFKKLAARLFKYESDALKKIDALVTLTEEETVIFQSIGYTGAVCVAPTCFNIIREQPEKNENEEFSIFHIGAMDWKPNYDGMEWFLKNVWPLIVASHPQIKFFIAGNKMPERFFSYQSKNCQVLGRVPDSMQFMLEHSVMIVPLFSGSGIRVKIVEGFALGKAIISTSLGAEGLHYRHMENIIIADTAVEMYKAIVECYQSPALREQLGKNARLLAQNYYDMHNVGETVFNFYRAISIKESTNY